MRSTLVILEDDALRTGEMLRVLESSAPDIQPIYFDNANALLEWFKENHAQVVLVSLDHDLPLRRVDGELVDFGTGREVVDYLVGLPIKIPVIVHSSNEPASVGMVMALAAAGWQHARVYPNDDLEWIADAWIKTVRQLWHTDDAQ